MITSKVINQALDGLDVEVIEVRIDHEHVVIIWDPIDTLPSVRVTSFIELVRSNLSMHEGFPGFLHDLEKIFSRIELAYPEFTFVLDRCEVYSREVTLLLVPIINTPHPADN